VPMVRQGSVLAGVDWDIALQAAGSVIRGKRAFVLASPMLSNEALFLLSELVRQTGGAGAFRVEQGPEAPLPGVEDLALRADRAANSRGAELLGFRRSDTPLSGMQSGDVLIVADEELAGVDAKDAAKASGMIVIGTTLPPWARHLASAVLPIANRVEEEGTFTNLRGRVQRFLQAKAAPGFARPSWFVLGDLLTAVGGKGAYFLASEAFAALAGARSEFAGMSYDSLGLKGAMLAGAGDRTTVGAGA
jgi:NADH-quinone oxidoreductase subunit G